MEVLRTSIFQPLVHTLGRLLTDQAVGVVQLSQGKTKIGKAQGLVGCVAVRSAASVSWEAVAEPHASEVWERLEEKRRLQDGGLWHGCHLEPMLRVNSLRSLL